METKPSRKSASSSLHSTALGRQPASVASTNNRWPSTKSCYVHEPQSTSVGELVKENIQRQSISREHKQTCFDFRNCSFQSRLIICDTVLESDWTATMFQAMSGLPVALLKVRFLCIRSLVSKDKYIYFGSDEIRLECLFAVAKNLLCSVRVVSHVLALRARAEHKYFLRLRSNSISG